MEKDLNLEKDLASDSDVEKMDEEGHAAAADPEVEKMDKEGDAAASEQEVEKMEEEAAVGLPAASEQEVEKMDKEGDAAASEQASSNEEEGHAKNRTSNQGRKRSKPEPAENQVNGNIQARITEFVNELHIFVKNYKGKYDEKFISEFINFAINPTNAIQSKKKSRKDYAEFIDDIKINFLTHRLSTLEQVLNTISKSLRIPPTDFSSELKIKNLKDRYEGYISYKLV